MRMIVAFLFCLSSLYSERVHIISSFPIDNLMPISSLAKIMEDTGFEISTDEPDGSVYLRKIKRVLVMNPCFTPSTLQRLPKRKLVLFNWESVDEVASYAEYYSRIYTFNDNLVDNVKFFKFYYPFRLPMRKELLPFDQRKLCTMVAGKTIGNRVEIVNFFHTKPTGDFEYYGFKPFGHTEMYRGVIPGTPWGDEKISVLNQYRFCICFENECIEGYITEKIFACFAGGAIPIYSGAPNIEKYIPKGCYIDCRDFRSYEELYQFIKSMPEEMYQRYIENIRSYLESEKSDLFSSKHFSEIISEAINQ